MQNYPQGNGKKGEELAREYLEKHGYEVLETNWRYRKLEVDIIAKKEEIIAFVEVKTRSSNAFGEPEVFVTAQKQKHLVAAAHHYLVEKNTTLEARFDIIAITGQALKHFEDAFYPRI